LNGFVCAAVLAYGAPTDVARALGSLRQAIHTGRIILVQNGLDDSEIDRLVTEYPDVYVMRNRTNLGAAGGRNLAIRAARELGADYLFFLDRDAYVQPEAIDALIEVAESRTDAALVSCLVLAANNPAQVHSAGGAFDLATLSEIHHRDYPSVPVTRVDFVVTTAALVKMKVAEKVGLLDERYFAYYEDLDWAQRAREMGFQHYVVTSAIGYHDEARSRFHPLIAYYLTRNKFLFLQTHGFIGGLRDLRVWRKFIEMTAHATRYALALTPLGFTCQVAHWQGFCDFARGRFGRGPAWIERSSDEYLESRVRDTILKSSIYAVARSVKRQFRRGSLEA
jgi:GT2 family glycosyltransferase